MKGSEQLLMIASLCKHGSTEDIKRFFADRKEETEEETFVSYMDFLIRKSGMSRARIVDSVGLSRDYMYKVLRGDKRTVERDYLIAVCLSMKANVLETQKVLELYPFPFLDQSQQRDGMILAAIHEGVTSYVLNEWLEKCRLPLLKVNPDMPSAVVGPGRSTDFHPDRLYSSLSRGHTPKETRRKTSMEVTNTFSAAERYGNAPVDLFVMGELELKEEDGSKVYAVAVFYPGEDPIYGIAARSIQDEKNKEKTNKMLEQYSSLEDAVVSPYFKYFLDLEKITDQKYAEALAKVNDTRNDNFRMGMNFGSEGLELYCEGFNSTQPEYSEYMQIRQTRQGCIFSATHRSCFLKYDMEQLMYEAYYGTWEEPEYLFEISSLDDLGKYDYFLPAFIQCLEIMQKYITKHGLEEHFNV